jgi:hypothetical protein
MVIDRLLRREGEAAGSLGFTTSLKPVHGGEALRRRDHVVA